MVNFTTIPHFSQQYNHPIYRYLYNFFLQLFNSKHIIKYLCICSYILCKIEHFGLYEKVGKSGRVFCFIHFPIDQQLIVDLLSQNNVSMKSI